MTTPNADANAISSQRVLIVHIQAKPGRGDDLIRIFTPCIQSTHREEGCLKYALNRDRSNPDHLTLIEAWRSQADLDRHLAQPHIAALGDALSSASVLEDRPALVAYEALAIGDRAKGML